MIGQRLKLARAASGLSLRELQEAIENRVTAQAIGKYERDEDMPSSGVLSALARALAYRRITCWRRTNWSWMELSFERKASPRNAKKLLWKARRSTCSNAT